mmetsp:Transcript_9482/g.10991  ORF Transcript_9482/g.10991 Transcript_9482/m.10991 type:complete len:224 (-) Transcript_9482:425-1096(-)|eukprot:CAMPEP_0197852578 /NCGR_PEP_ID=MMETSP1438-20131217/20957_1 /TAXON_ID=1461541 /ORGANISM="Pterosperma sp., Strain CCMP1384" /LENGTH=223 /DNA_ID=CAMNT_0043466695 /DNA_START=111 /DNA_END=782 /DNA_ORIENTATION=+
MGINLGDTVPNFTAETTHGQITWHEYIEGSWAILFSHPADYTPVCTTELGTVSKLLPEFEKRGVKVAALSCDNVDNHKGWIKDIEAAPFCGSTSVTYPIIADPSRDLAVSWGMVDPSVKDAEGLPLTCRAVFVIGPDKTLKLSMLYPASTGRNFNEVLRCIDSLQLTANHKVATPADWTHGNKCMVVPTLSDDEANKTLGGFEVTEVPSGKKYLRMTADPSSK